MLNILLAALLLGQDPAAALGEKLIRQALEQDKRDAARVRSMACANTKELKNLDENDREEARKFNLTVQEWLGTGCYTYRVISEFPADREGYRREHYRAIQVGFVPDLAAKQPPVPAGSSPEEQGKNDVLNNLRGLIYLDPTTLGIREIDGFLFRSV